VKVYMSNGRPTSQAEQEQTLAYSLDVAACYEKEVKKLGWGKKKRPVKSLLSGLAVTIVVCMGLMLYFFPVGAKFKNPAGQSRVAALGRVIESEDSEQAIALAQSMGIDLNNEAEADRQLALLGERVNRIRALSQTNTNPLSSGLLALATLAGHENEPWVKGWTRSADALAPIVKKARDDAAMSGTSSSKSLEQVLGDLSNVSNLRDQAARNPTDAFSQHKFALGLALQGKPEEARAQIIRANIAHPQDVGIMLDAVQLLTTDFPLEAAQCVARHVAATTRIGALNPESLALLKDFKSRLPKDADPRTLGIIDKVIADAEAELRRKPPATLK
jgi:hypothetical protein